MKSKKPSGYFWRFWKMLIREGILYPQWVKDFSKENGSKIIYKINLDYVPKLNQRQTKYLVRKGFFLKVFFFSLFLISNLFAFQGVGDCEKLLSDYAQLGNKSVFLPAVLSGHCVVQSEKHFPFILKSAGYSYKEKNGYIDIKPIPPYQEKPAEPWQPKSLYYDVSFVFLNTSSALDCGLKMGDVVASSYNLNYSFSLGLDSKP